MSAIKTLAYNVQTGQSLATELFQKDAVMTGRFSHFDGNYPERESVHVCKSYWQSPVYQDGNGRQYVKGVQRVQYDCWRHVYSKSGVDLYCPACWHDRVIGYCRKIETISFEYRRLDNLAYLDLSESDYRKTISKITTHNNRNEVAVNYTSFPTDNGRILLHDAPGWLGGETLPGDRTELYSLLETWAATPLGKRAGHGLESWGKAAQESRKTAQEKAQNDKRVGKVLGTQYSVVMRFLEVNLDNIKQGPKGMKFDKVDVGDFLDILESAGLEYSLEGDVTDSRDREQLIPLLSVTTKEPDGPEGERSGSKQPSFPKILL